ncbi:MAG: hypothetical protein AB1467_02330 [Candidatus Diapherotrites archaeon]
MPAKTNYPLTIIIILVFAVIVLGALYIFLPKETPVNKENEFIHSDLNEEPALDISDPRNYDINYTPGLPRMSKPLNLMYTVSNCRGEIKDNTFVQTAETPPQEDWNAPAKVVIKGTTIDISHYWFTLCRNEKPMEGKDFNVIAVFEDERFFVEEKEDLDVVTPLYNSNGDPCFCPIKIHVILNDVIKGTRLLDVRNPDMWAAFSQVIEVK